MRKLVLAVGAASLVAISPAFAHGGGGGGGGMSGAHGDFGGNSLGNMSSSGLSNTNGPNSSDRDFGMSRAADRHEIVHGHGHHSHHGNSNEESHESASADIHEH